MHQNIFDRDLLKVCLKEIDVNPMKICKINEQPIDCKLLNMKEFSKLQELKLEISQDSNKIWEQLIEFKKILQILKNLSNMIERYLSMKRLKQQINYKLAHTIQLRRFKWIRMIIAIISSCIYWHDKYQKLEEESAMSKY